jgi:hypothetical protein
MSDREETPAGRDWRPLCGPEPVAGAGRGVRRNLKAKLTCFSPVLSGGWIGAPQPQREIGSN